MFIRDYDQRLQVFLGGTCTEPDYRKDLIPLLNVPFFDPVIRDRDWTKDDEIRENKIKNTSSMQLYLITPYTQGAYSIAESVHESWKVKHDDYREVVFAYLREYQGKIMDVGVLKSIEATANILRSNNVRVFTDLKSLANYLNSKTYK